MSKQKKQKRPKHSINPSVEKTPRISPNLEHPEEETISWQFEYLDLEDTSWSWKGLDGNTIWNQIYPKLINFERNKWKEVLGKRNHFIPVSDITKKAQDHLKMKFEHIDVDDLVSLSFSGKERLWGIRVNSILKIIWWDPNHEICPAKKKHT